MLWMSDRVSPCSDLWFVSSDARFTLSAASVFSTVMPDGSRCASSPLGPLTFTVLPSTATVTPLGIATGSFPIRDMRILLPHHGDELAAGARLPRLTVGHQALVRAQDSQPKPVADARDLARADVASQPRRRDALQLADDGLAAGVLEAHAQHLPSFVGLERGIVLNVVVLFQDPGDLGLHLRHRNVDASVLRPAGIADPRQHIGDRVGHAHSWIRSPLVSESDVEE